MTKRRARGANPIEYWRFHTGTSIRALSMASGVSRGEIRNCERCLVDPRASTMMKLSDATGIDVGELALYFGAEALFDGRAR